MRLQELKEELKHIEYNINLDSFDNDYALCSGSLTFEASYEDKQLITDTYDVELYIPLNEYNLPKSKEFGGRIPRESDFHVGQDGDMCLAAPLEVRQKWLEKPSVSGLVNNLVVPFLYSNSYLEMYKKRPYDDLKHGGEGIIEFYKNYFKVDSWETVVCLLRIIALDNYRGHMTCPCGSGKKVRDCHGRSLLEIKSIQPIDFILIDLKNCLEFTLGKGFLETFFCNRNYESFALLKSNGISLKRSFFDSRLNFFYTRYKK